MKNVGHVETVNHVEAVNPAERRVSFFSLFLSLWVPNLLVTRFEYANLFHTVTDWYSAYVVTGLPNRPHIVFVDGHCTNFTKPVCFRLAILSPLGYETTLFKGLTGEMPLSLFFMFGT
ncbi:hypothetical protein ISN44_As13g017440, partial [Arabidopsis suecica]